ncbi:MAG: aminotransferase class I/II-fold pyridoxal phosphate-dependent enzyme [bacterium]
MKQLKSKIKENLKILKENSLFRELKTVEKREGNFIWINGKKLLNCSSNDYLGIAGNHELKKEFLSLIAENAELLETSFSSSSSRLLTGNSTIYDETEKEIAHLYGKEECLIFSSGYHLNSGFFAPIFEKGDLIVADKLVHASIIDGIMLSRADHFRYNHLDYTHLTKYLKENRAKYRRVVVVTESVFSMDGDVADLGKLTEIAENFSVELFVDEAHAVGCIGEKGLGVCEKNSVTHKIDYIVGTFGKAVGGFGAFILCDKEIKDYLINKCRSFIFTTALPPINIFWINFVLKKIVKMEKEREKLAEITQLLRAKLLEKNFLTNGSTHIVPLITGDEASTVSFFQKMEKRGVFVPAIRPPTVPVGSSRLRFSFTTEFSNDDIEFIVKAIEKE